MWLGIFAFGFLLAVLAMVYLMRRALRLWPARRIYEKNKVLGILSSLWPVLLCLPFLGVSLVATVIAFVHLFLFWALTDGVLWIIKKAAGWQFRKRNYSGLIALSLTAVYLLYGWIMAHTVLQKNYTLETEKDLGKENLRVVALADLHAGTTLSEEEFLLECQRINALSPDVVVICGDLVDDDTTREKMLTTCEALGSLQATYGVFFVFGNHDRGYFRGDAFDGADLTAALEQNGVRVLEDEVFPLGEEILLVGRRDASHRDRQEAEALLSEIGKEKYVILLDHQPNDYAATAKAGPDLVLSGHTHGGHIFPAGPIGLLMGANDALYGLEVRGQTAFIVTSGISGWAIPFKTFATSEFVVIDIRGK